MVSGVGGSASLQRLAGSVERYSASGYAPDRGNDLASELSGLRLLIDRLELCFSSLCGQLADSGLWEQEGFTSPIAFVRETCRMRGGAAADRLHIAEQAPRLVSSLEALDAGEIGLAHLAALARTAEFCGESFSESHLLKEARRLSPRRFDKACLSYRHSANPEGCVEEEQNTRANRYLEISTSSEDGAVFLRAMLDKTAGAGLKAALEPLARLRGPEDGRSSRQRNADALEELCWHALDRGLLPQSGGVRPHLQVTASLETLEGRLGAPAAELMGGFPISSHSLMRLTCDCSLTRVVFGPESMVIDVGRTQRVVSGSRRRALHARDGGCVFPGCDRQTTWTNPHHLQPWARGGGTELSNQVSLCLFHHRLMHDDGWQLLKTDHGGWLPVRPPTQLERELVRISKPDPPAAA